MASSWIEGKDYKYYGNFQVPLKTWDQRNTEEQRERSAICPNGRPGGATNNLRSKPEASANEQRQGTSVANEQRQGTSDSGQTASLDSARRNLCPEFQSVLQTTPTKPNNRSADESGSTMSDASPKSSPEYRGEWCFWPRVILHVYGTVMPSV